MTLTRAAAVLLLASHAAAANCPQANEPRAGLKVNVHVRARRAATQSSRAVALEPAVLACRCGGADAPAGVFSHPPLSSRAGRSRRNEAREFSEWL